jgi:hypothetical protein
VFGQATQRPQAAKPHFIVSNKGFDEYLDFRAGFWSGY